MQTNDWVVNLHNKCLSIPSDDKMIISVNEFQVIDGYVSQANVLSLPLIESISFYRQCNRILSKAEIYLVKIKIVSSLI